MARGSKTKYTSKQKRMARDIEKGYEKRGSPKKRAERIAWATVNKEFGKAGTNKFKTKEPSRSGGHKGGSRVSHRERSLAAKRGWRTRRRHEHAHASA